MYPIPPRIYKIKLGHVLKMMMGRDAKWNQEVWSHQEEGPGQILLEIGFLAS